MILAYLIVALFLAIGIYNCRKYLKLKKRSKHFVEVDAVKVATYYHEEATLDDRGGRDTIYSYVYKYEYDGQEKEFIGHRDRGKYTKIIYDKETDRAYDMKYEKIDLSFGVFFIMFVLLVIVALVVRYVDPSSAGGY